MDAPLGLRAHSWPTRSDPILDMKAAQSPRFRAAHPVVRRADEVIE